MKKRLQWIGWLKKRNALDQSRRSSDKLMGSAGVLFIFKQKKPVSQSFTAFCQVRWDPGVPWNVLGAAPDLGPKSRWCRARPWVRCCNAFIRRPWDGKPPTMLPWFHLVWYFYDSLYTSMIHHYIVNIILYCFYTSWLHLDIFMIVCINNTDMEMIYQMLFFKNVFKWWIWWIFHVAL